MNVVPPGHGRSPLRTSPAASQKTLEWVPLEKHALFRSGSGGMSPVIAAADTDGPSDGFFRNLLAWDANSCRLYFWDAQSRCVHRLVVRFRDQVPSSSSPAFSSAVLEAASPSEKLATDIEINYTVHRISLNTSGSTMLLAGSEGMSVIYLYEQTCTNNSNKSCRTIMLGSGLFPNQYSGLKILQATWHPYSSNHIGVLSSDSVFRLFDLSSDLEQAEQEFYIQVEKPFGSQNTVSICPISFSFGGQHFWERFSVDALNFNNSQVFILYNNGSLYILCPIVPFGSLCKWTYLKEIYEDVHAYELKSSDSRVGRNSALIITWLEATFPELADPQMEGDDVLVLSARPYALLDASLALQGPLVHACMEEKKNGTDVSRSYCEGKPVAFIFNSIGKDSVFITGWSSGFLQIEALIDEVQPLWKAGLSPRLRVNANGNIEGIATICQSYMEEANMNYSRRLDCALSLVDAADAVENKDLPRLLKLAIVDLSLSECAKNGCLLSLVPDSLVSERFYCLHNDGIDMVILHFLPFSSSIDDVEVKTAPPSVHPILTTSQVESSPSSFFCGFLMVADSYGHSQLVGVTPTNECLVLEVKAQNERLPFHFSLEVKPVGSTETLIPEIVSKELLSGPRAIIIPPSTSLRSLNPDSIEGRSTLHHYIKLFHENYVEYAHKVYIELEQHGAYVKTIIENQLKRVKEVEQSLLKVRNNEKGIEDRIARAFKVYELLEQRLQNFKALPASNKKPLSKAERQFDADLDRISDQELDALKSSMEALDARLKRYVSSSPVGSSNTARQAAGRRKDYLTDSQVSKLKSSLDLLSSFNIENTRKVRLIEDRLSRQQK